MDTNDSHGSFDELFLTTKFYIKSGKLLPTEKVSFVKKALATSPLG